jgi:hypothetical protein
MIQLELILIIIVMMMIEIREGSLDNGYFDNGSSNKYKKS